MCCGNTKSDAEKQREDLYQGQDFSDPSYRGLPPDERCRKGPIEDRGCTDILCCMTFIAFVVLLGYIAYMGYINGYKTDNYHKLGAVYDADGNKCGQDPGFMDHKYLYFWLPVPNYMNRTTCLKACPQIGVQFAVDQPQQDTDIQSYYEDPTNPGSATNQLECKTNTEVAQCYGKSSSFLDIADMLNGGSASGFDNMFLIYPTTPRFYRFCIPSQLNETISSFYSEIEGIMSQLDFLNNLVDDLDITRTFVMASGLIALFLGFVWMVVMKMCAGFITWTAIAGILASCVGLSYYTYGKGCERQDELDALVVSAGAEKPYNYKMWMFYACAFFTFLLVCTIVCLCKKIRIAIQIMEASADFVTEVCYVLLVPPAITISVILWSALWMTLAIFVWAQGEIIQAAGGAFYSKTIWTDEQEYMWWIWVFGFLWINAFLNAMNQFIIASAASIWYFSPRDPESPSNKLVKGAISKSIYRVFRYHLGTLAFGSFILALVQLARIIMVYVEKQLRSSGADKQSDFVKWSLKICHCCLACFERFIKFINKNAYIQCAITGNSFCVSCKDAFFLILRNAFLFAIAAGIGEIFVFIGKLFITLFTVLCCFYLIDNYEGGNVHFIYGPLFIIGAIAYITGTMFMSVWGMGADTILVCYCLDKEYAKKGGPPSDYCPVQLKKFIDNPKMKEQARQAQVNRKAHEDIYKQKMQKDPTYRKQGFCCDCC